MRYIKVGARRIVLHIKSKLSLNLHIIYWKRKLKRMYGDIVCILINMPIFRMRFFVEFLLHKQLEKLPLIEDRVQTDRANALPRPYALDINLWPMQSFCFNVYSGHLTDVNSFTDYCVWNRAEFSWGFKWWCMSDFLSSFSTSYKTEWYCHNKCNGTAYIMGNNKIWKQVSNVIWLKTASLSCHPLWRRIDSSDLDFI